MPDKYYHPDSDFFTKRNLVPPSATPHGTEQDVTDNLKRLMPNSWVLEGDWLIGQTEMGRLVQKIPSDYILVGADEKGLPMFRKVSLEPTPKT